MEKEMIGVCNLGEAIARRNLEAGRQQGIQQGIQQGMQRGRQQGIQQGMQQGITKGENRLNELMARLFAMDRFDDAKRCTEDTEYRNKLYKEFKLV